MATSEKRKLYLIVDNAPEEKTLPFHDRLEVKHQKKYERLLKKEKEKLEQKIKEIEQKKENKFSAIRTRGIKEQQKRYLTAMMLGIGATIVASAAYIAVTGKDSEPVIITPLDQDLNNDGVWDAYILQRNNHKIPMYGVKEYGRIRYVGGKKIGYYISTSADYQSIEDELNKEF